LTILVGETGKVYEVLDGKVVEVTDPEKIKSAQDMSDTVQGIECESALSAEQTSAPGIMFTFVKLP
ncbi:MAG TPA: hypothetical protein VN851_11695, partial [Thermoanaerobaculia bacterium]|nr:hypothetical protein [Thermoanaerobaculia bacterium]